MPHWNMGRYAKKEKQGFKWNSETGSLRTTFLKGLGAVVLILLVSGLLFNASERSVLAHADYNTSFSHTRTAIYQENTGNWDSSRWTFNSTCVSFVGQLIRFDYSTGASGSGGNNCNSADIAINKASISLATVSAKQLEMDFEWAMNAGGGCQNTCYKRAIIAFRTNSTLPAFRENYDPFADSQNKLVYDTCPIINSALCGVNGGSGPYIQHDPSKSINAEGPGNDIVNSLQLPGSGSPTAMNLQMVLNYTGSTHFFAYKEALGGNTNSLVTGNFATYLAPGTDYYLLLMGEFNTNVTPSGTIVWQFDMGGHRNVPTPDTFGVWSVPSSCEDRLNLAFCNAAPPAGYSAPSTSQLSLFNPVSWIVYLGKVVIWAIQQALALVAGGLAYFFSLINANAIGPILQSLWSLVAGFFWGLIVGVLNTVGALVGFPTLGTAFQTIMSNLYTLLLGTNGILSQVFTGIGDLANLFLNFAKFMFGGFFFDFVIPFINLFSLLTNLLASILKVLGLIFKGLNIGVPFLFLFDALWLMIGLNDEGVRFVESEWWPLHRIIVIGIIQVADTIITSVAQYLYWVITMVELAVEDVKPSVAVAG